MESSLCKLQAMKVHFVIKYSGSSDVELFPLSRRTEDKNADKTGKYILNVTLLCLLLSNNFVCSFTGKVNDISSPPRLDGNSGPLRSLPKACRAHFSHRNHASS